MYTNTKVTLYRLIGGVYVRSIHNAFYTENKISNFEKTGLSTCDTAKVIIAHSGVDLSFTTGKDYIVNGECPLLIDNATQQTLSESLKRLKEYGFLTITSADAKLFGSADMWNYQLSCK